MIKTIADVINFLQELKLNIDSDDIWQADDNTEKMMGKKEMIYFMDKLINKLIQEYSNDSF